LAKSSIQQLGEQKMALETRKQDFRERKLEMDRSTRERRIEQQGARKREKEERETRRLLGKAAPDKDADEEEADLEGKLQEEEDFLEKLQAGKIAPISPDELEKDGFGASLECALAGRKPNKWEDIASWLFSFPANTLPKTALRDDGKVDKKKMLVHWMGCMKAIPRPDQPNQTIPDPTPAPPNCPLKT
jgi:hypothetical protein